MMYNEITDNLGQQAEAFARCFTTATRPSTGREYVKKTDDAPDALTNLIFGCHMSATGVELLPDDYIYRFVSEALDAISENVGRDADEVRGEIEGDTYTSDLMHWLSERGFSAVDDTLAESGSGLGSTEAMVREAQAQEKMSVFSYVFNSLQEAEIKE